MRTRSVAELAASVRGKEPIDRIPRHGRDQRSVSVYEFDANDQQKGRVLRPKNCLHGSGGVDVVE
jgi:hypothetical protein